jgi:peptidoglycan/LPS O-acetylase OafA/YrhL
LLVGLYFAKFAAIGFVNLQFDATFPQGAGLLRTIITNLLLVQAFDSKSWLSWNAPSWSISTELWIYLIFSFTCLLTPTRAAHTLVMVGMAVCAAAVIFILSPDFLETNTAYAFFRCVFGFSVGHLVCRVWKAVPPRSGSLLELSVLVLIVIYVCLIGNTVVSMTAPTVFGVAVLVFAQEAGCLSRVLTTRPFVQLATWSYSIYMVHWIVRNFLVRANEIVEKSIERGTIPSYLSMNHIWTTRLLTVAYLVAVVVLAAAAYRWIEQPARRYFNRVSDRVF